MFSRKKTTIFMVLSLVMTGWPFFIFPQDVYITNPVEQMHLESAFAPADKSIPLTVKTFYDPTAQIDCENLNESDFSDCTQQFFPGFYSGDLWIQIEFPDTQITNGKIYHLSFGITNFLVADVMQYDNSAQKWVSIGSLGSGLQKKFKTSYSHIPSIKIDETYFPKEDFHKLRIRMISYTNTPVTLSLTPSEYFHKKEHLFSTTRTVLIALILALLFIMLSTGLLLKDRLCLMVGFSAIFIALFSAILHEPKIPALYTRIFSTHHLINLADSLLTTIIFSYLIKECGRKKLFSPSIYVNLNVIGFCFILALSGAKQKHIYLIVNLGIILSSINLTILGNINLRKGKKEICFLLRSWALLLSLYSIIRILDLIQKFSGRTILMADFDALHLQNLLFLFMLLPVTAITLNRHRIKAKNFEGVIAGYRQENEKLLESQKLFTSINKLILDNENKIYNLLNSSLTSTPQKNTPEIILESLDKNQAFLLSELIMATNETPEDNTVNLEAAFNSSMEYQKATIAGRNITMKIRTENIENKNIYINKHILDLILNVTLSTTLRLCLENSKFSVLLKLEDGQMIFKTTTTTDAQIHSITSDLLKNDSQNKLLGFSLLKKLLPYYSGEFSTEDISTGFTFSIKLGTQISENNHDFMSSKNIINHSQTPAVQSANSLLTIDGKNPSIMFASGEASSKNLIEVLLGPQCQLYMVDTGEQAWKQLKTACILGSNLPDMILCDINLPIINGVELLRKCKNEDTLRDIPFIFILQPTDKNKINNLLALGAVDCIIRPYTADRINRCIYTVFSLTNKIKRSVISTITKTLMGENQILAPSAIPVEAKKQVNSLVLTNTQNVIFTNGGLSAREQQIAVLISEGLTDKEISEKLSISIGTVTTHNKRIFKKLDVHSRIELVNKVR